MSNSDLLGYVAALITTASFLPQAWLTFRTRKANAVSSTMYVVLCLGVSLWLAYGVMLAAWPIILANAVTLAISVFILAMKLRYG